MSRTRRFRTAHAVEYREARARSLKTDKRSLTAHWREGKAYSSYNDPIVDMAWDVGISTSTVKAHMSLYEMFPTREELLDAAEHYHTYSYMRLMRLHDGTEKQSYHSKVWQCAVCGSRELREVTEEELAQEPGANVIAPAKFREAK